MGARGFGSAGFLPASLNSPLMGEFGSRGLSPPSPLGGERAGVRGAANSFNNSSLAEPSLVSRAAWIPFRRSSTLAFASFIFAINARLAVVSPSNVARRRALSASAGFALSFAIIGSSLIVGGAPLLLKASMSPSSAASASVVLAAIVLRNSIAAFKSFSRTLASVRSQMRRMTRRRQ